MPRRCLSFWKQRPSRHPRPFNRPPRRVRPTTTQPRPVGRRRRWHKNSIKNTSRGEGSKEARKAELGGGRKRRPWGRSTNRRKPLHSSNDGDGRIPLPRSLALSGRPASATARFYAPRSLPACLAVRRKLLRCLPKKDNLYYLSSSQEQCKN